MNRPSRYLLLGVGCLCLACSSNLETLERLNQEHKAQGQALEQKIQALEARIKQQEDKLTELNQHLKSIKDSLARYKAQAQERADRLHKQDINLDSQIALLTDEIREFEKRVLQGRLGSSKSLGKKSSLNIRALYNKGMRYYNHRKYQEAVEAFSQISSPSLKNDLADNAQYWIGECYSYLEEYEQALTHFTKVFAFKKTNKDDDALIKIGYIYLKLDDREKALESFKKFVDDYPYSEYIKDAKKQVAELESQLKLSE